MKKTVFLLICFFVLSGTVSFAQVGEESPKVNSPKSSPFLSSPKLQPKPAGSTVPEDKDSKTNAPQNNQAQELQQQTVENANSTSQPVYNNKAEKEKKKFKINFKKVADGVDIIIGVAIAGVAVFFMVIPTVKVLINQYS